MAEQEINIRIEQEAGVCPGEDWFRRIAQRTLEVAGISVAAEMGLVITDGETVQQLNRTYRGEDQPTDVLAFRIVSHAEQEDDHFFALPPNGVSHLGEVVVSYPQAVQQAQEYGHSVEQELALLVVHGVLHLLGYDDEQPEAKRYMRAKEKEVLGKVQSLGGQYHGPRS